MLNCDINSDVMSTYEMHYKHIALFLLVTSIGEALVPNSLVILTKHNFLVAECQPVK